MDSNKDNAPSGPGSAASAQDSLLGSGCGASGIGAEPLKTACRELIHSQDYDGVWNLCRDTELRHHQIQESGGFQWTIDDLYGAVKLYAKHDHAPDHSFRLAWLITELGAMLEAAQADVALPLKHLDRDNLDSFEQVAEAVEMMQGNGDSLFLRSACLLHREAVLQAERADGKPNAAGVSHILKEISERLPVPERSGLRDTGVKDVGFLGPLATLLTSITPFDGIAEYFSHCDSDSLAEICKHVCQAAKGFPLSQAEKCFALSLALGSQINWSFRLGDPIDGICAAAAEKRLTATLLSQVERLPSETVQSFLCKAALAAYEANDNSVDPLDVLRAVEDIGSRDETTNTLACWMANKKDIAGALKAMNQAVAIDACESALIRTSRTCASEADRDAVLVLARKMRKGENAAEVLIAVAETIADQEAPMALLLLQEAVDRAGAPDDPEDGALRLAEAAQAMHGIGASEDSERVLDLALDLSNKIDVGYKQDYAIGRIAEAFAKVGQVRRLPQVFTRLNDPTEVSDILEDIASICAGNGELDAFSELLRSSMEGLRLNREETPEEDIAKAIIEFADKPDRATVFGIVEDQAQAGNLVASMALARAIGQEGRIDAALEILRGIDVAPPPKPKGIDGTNITDDHLDRMSRSLADVLGRSTESQSMFELLDAAFEEAGGDNMFDEIEPSPEEEERNAVPGKIVAVLQSLLDAAVARDRPEIIDGLISFLRETARRMPRTTFKDSDEVFLKAIEETVEYLAKLGLPTQAQALADDALPAATRGKCYRDIAGALVKQGNLDAARSVMSSIDGPTQDSIRVSIARELAATDAHVARDELAGVQDLKARAEGVRSMAGILAQHDLAASDYGELLQDVAAAHSASAINRDIPDWCFFTMPLALASAGKAEDIPRFLDLVSPDNERREELQTHGLGEGIDVLVQNGFTDGLEDFISRLPSSEVRDGRRKRLALKLGATDGAEPAESVIATIEGDDTRSRAQRELVDALIERDRIDDAIRIAEHIDPESRQDGRYLRDDALKGVVLHCVDAGDMKKAVAAGDLVNRAWYKMWVMAMFAKGFITGGKTGPGLDLLRKVLSTTKDAGADYEDFHVDIIDYFATGCGEHLDVGLLADYVAQISSPKLRAKAAERVAALCCSRGDRDKAIEIAKNAEEYACSHDDNADDEGARSGVIRAYVVCGNVEAARKIPESVTDQKAKDRLLCELDVAVAKQAGGLDAPSRVTLDAWTDMVDTVAGIKSRGRRIETCRRLLDLPSVQTTAGCRDHLVQIALRTYRDLDPRIQGGLQEGLVSTLVTCGRPDAAAGLIKYEPDDIVNMSFLRRTEAIATHIGGSVCPENWIRLLGSIDVPSHDAKQGMVQQACYHLCQRSKGHGKATEEALRLIQSSGLALSELATSYVHWHMAVSMLGAEAMPWLLRSLADSAMNERVSRSAALAFTAILIRSERYGEAQRIAESCPQLGLSGVFQQ